MLAHNNVFWYEKSMDRTNDWSLCQNAKRHLPSAQFSGGIIQIDI